MFPPPFRNLARSFLSPVCKALNVLALRSSGESFETTESRRQSFTFQVIQFRRSSFCRGKKMTGWGREPADSSSSEMSTFNPQPETQTHPSQGFPLEPPPPTTTITTTGSSTNTSTTLSLTPEKHAPLLLTNSDSPACIVMSSRPPLTNGAPGAGLVLHVPK